MKIFSALLFLFLVVALPAFGQSKQDGERENNSLNRKTVNGFGGHLIVVENPREFIQ